MKTVSFTYNNITIKFNDNKLTSLTDMWKAIKGSRNQSPSEWLRLPDTEKFLKSLTKRLNTGKSRIIETKRGRNGGTYAHWQIAAVYAKYLSPTLHIQFNEYIKSHIEEEASPDLKMEKAIELYQKQGKSMDWIKTRFEGISYRKELTSALKRNINEFGQYDFPQITDDVNRMILGKSAREFKKNRNLKSKDKTRDHLSTEQLMFIALAERTMIKTIEKGVTKLLPKYQGIGVTLDSIHDLSKAAEIFKE